MRSRTRAAPTGPARSSRPRERESGITPASKISLPSSIVRFWIIVVSVGLPVAYLQLRFVPLFHTKPKSKKKNKKLKGSTLKDYQSTLVTKIKPWESTPPMTVPLFSTNNTDIRQRHTCIEAIRNRHEEVFGKLWKLDSKVLLVDPAYTGNVGDNLLTISELQFLKSNHSEMHSVLQCHYRQAGKFYEPCNDVIVDSGPYSKKTTQKVRTALWQAGGSWGDVWKQAQKDRVQSFRVLLRNGYQVVSMPQSLYYKSKQSQEEEAAQIKEMVALGLNLAVDEKSKTPSKPRHLGSSVGLAMARSTLAFTWRDKRSFEIGEQLYPFARNLLVPDMSFQLGPYEPIRRHPQLQVDLLLVLRHDSEMSMQGQRDNKAVRKLLPRADITFRLVDWIDRFQIFQSDDIFFTDSVIELLSLGTVVVCDRLDATILAYLTGLPFVFVDDDTSTISRSLQTAFDVVGEPCLHGSKSNWAMASSLKTAIDKAVFLFDKDSTSR